MKSNPLGPSRLWKYISSVGLTATGTKKLSSFRSNSVNFKLALFDPDKNGRRYLATLIYCLCNSMSQEDWDCIRRIKNRNLWGRPIAITFDDEVICLDYLQAAFEVGFVRKHLGNHDTPRILEIGAGYGRTCHAIMSNWPIQEYCIVDLDGCLNLSRSYLGKVLDCSQFDKLRFVGIGGFDSLRDQRFDLCINIDSFSEMDAKTVTVYLQYINERCHYLYVKNPVCNNVARPLLGALSWRAALLRRIYNAMGTALFVRNTTLPDSVDIFNTRQVRAQAEKFISAYRPGTGRELIADGPVAPWCNYWQAVYGRGVINQPMRMPNE